MNHFNQNQTERILTSIVASPKLHAKWLNTLSFLENCGARKIAACEHPTLVREEMLKHAAEEFRHAHHLKRQIEKVSVEAMPTYSPQLMLGGIKTLHYLTALDLQTSRYLRKLGLSPNSIKEGAYVLVTYAIEVRAEELYATYDAILRKAGSRVSIKSILLEEKGHLEEMREELQKLESGLIHAQYVCDVEKCLYEKWFGEVAQSVRMELNKE